jgi:hypothetical protein
MAERYTIEDVPAWEVRQGVGHIIAGPGWGSGWSYWACGVQTPTGTIETSVPPRICRKCRAALDEQRKQHLLSQH